MKLKHLLMLILVTVTGFSASWALGIANAPTEWAKAAFAPYASNLQSKIAESPQPNESSAASTEGTDEETTTSNTVTISLTGKKEKYTSDDGAITIDVLNTNYSSSDQYCKIRKGDNFTVSSATQNITKIKFNFSTHTSPPSENTITASSAGESEYSRDNKYFIWTPNDAVSSVTFSNSPDGKDYYISSIEVTTGQDFDNTGTGAIFIYNSKPIQFQDGTFNDEPCKTVTYEFGQSNRGAMKIQIRPNTGCTVVYHNDNNNLEDVRPANEEETIYPPKYVSMVPTYIFTVTSADGKSKVRYLITLKQTEQVKLALKYEPETYTWNKHNGGLSFDQPTLSAYEVIDKKGTLGTDNVIEKIKGSLTYESDMETVAAVDNDGKITIKENGLGGAKIYAMFAGNTDYASGETSYNFIIEDGYSTPKIEKATPAPAMNDYNTDYNIVGDGETLVKVKFGGWKYGTNTTHDDHSYQPDKNSNNKRVDKWSDGEGASDCASIDGYENSFSGANDAMDEAMKLSEEEIRGSKRRGWFKSPTTDAEGNTVTYPFTLPVRGAYMTFEPQMNGYLTVYILQNGAWNTKGRTILKGQFRPHAFQVVNQRGLPLKQFTTEYSVMTKQTVTKQYKCEPKKDADGKWIKPDVYLKADGTWSDKQSHDEDTANIANWDELYTVINNDVERKQIEEYWASGPRGAQKVIELSTGSFMTIQKGIVKYRFHVTGHETYYFFSNFSKLGFCGANFVPDAYPAGTGEANDETQLQPTAELELSDGWEHIKFVQTASSKGGTYPSGVVRKKFLVKDNDDVKDHFSGYVNVDKVQVPQFKTITVRRDFVKDKWNTLTLPFNITQHRVEEIFGKGTELILLNGTEITGGGEAVRLHFIYHEIQNVLPGYPYLIKPTFEGVDTEATFTKNDKSVHKLLEFNDEKNVLTAFTVPVKHINPDIKQQKIVCGDYEARGIEGYSHPGWDEYDTKLAEDKSQYSAKYEEGDIFLSDGNGKLYVSKGSSYGKGYRSYIKYTGTSVPAKSIFMDYSGVDDNFDKTTTEIHFTELAPEAAMALGLRGVYNLNGQKVADKADNLPSGIYIVNGQKTVVK